MAQEFTRRFFGGPLDGKSETSKQRPRFIRVATFDDNDVSRILASTLKHDEPLPTERLKEHEYELLDDVDSTLLYHHRGCK